MGCSFIFLVSRDLIHIFMCLLLLIWARPVGRARFRLFFNGFSSLWCVVWRLSLASFVVVGIKLVLLFLFLCVLGCVLVVCCGIMFF